MISEREKVIHESLHSGKNIIGKVRGNEGEFKTYVIHVAMHIMIAERIKKEERKVKISFLLSSGKIAAMQQELEVNANNCKIPFFKYHKILYIFSNYSDTYNHASINRERIYFMLDTAIVIVDCIIHYEI